VAAALARVEQQLDTLPGLTLSSADQARALADLDRRLARRMCVCVLPHSLVTDPLVVMNADQRVAGTSEHSSARTRRCWPAPASPWPSTTTSLCPSLSFVQADVHAGVCALWVYRPARRTVRVSTGLERR
jgi:hypothetical protein